MSKFNPNKFIIADPNGVDVVMEFYSNARELIINGKKYHLVSNGEAFVIKEG